MPPTPVLASLSSVEKESATLRGKGRGPGAEPELHSSTPDLAPQPQHILPPEVALHKLSPTHSYPVPSLQLPLTHIFHCWAGQSRLQVKTSSEVSSPGSFPHRPGLTWVWFLSLPTPLVRSPRLQWHSINRAPAHVRCRLVSRSWCRAAVRMAALLCVSCATLGQPLGLAETSLPICKKRRNSSPPGTVAGGGGELNGTMERA